MVENSFIKWYKYILISIWIHLIGISLYIYLQSDTTYLMSLPNQFSSSSTANNTLAINLSSEGEKKVANSSKVLNSTGINQKSQNKTTIIAKNPTFAKQTPLYYPPRALEMGLVGTVHLKALVNTAGEIEELLIVKSSNYKILDNATINTVRLWKINPIIKNNQAISGWVEFNVVYNIKNS